MHATKLPAGLPTPLMSALPPLLPSSDSLCLKGPEVSFKYRSPCLLPSFSQVSVNQWFSPSSTHQTTFQAFCPRGLTPKFLTWKVWGGAKDVHFWQVQRSYGSTGPGSTLGESVVLIQQEIAFLTSQKFVLTVRCCIFIENFPSVWFLILQHVELCRSHWHGWVCQHRRATNPTL